MKKEILIDFTEGEKEDKVEITGKVILKRLNFAEKNQLEEEMLDIKLFGDTTQTKISTSKMKEFGIQKAIEFCDVKKTTYIYDKTKGVLVPSISPIDLKNLTIIKELPQDVGDKLFAEFNELNSINLKKNEK